MHNRMRDFFLSRLFLSCGFTLSLVALSVLSLACERQGKDYAFKKAPIKGIPRSVGQETFPPVEGTIPTYGVARDVVVSSLHQSAGDGALDGKKLFLTNCSACHQANGQGLPGAFPPLDGAKIVLSDNVERIASIMIYGLQGPIKVKGSDYNGVMAPLGNLKDEELAAIATYVRGAWSNKAGEVTPETFKAARQKWGARSMFTIKELGGDEES